MSDAELDELRAENERLRAKLSEAETRYTLVLEATNDGVWDWRVASDEAFFSRRWKAILGQQTDFDDRFWRRYYENGFEARRHLDEREA